MHHQYNNHFQLTSHGYLDAFMHVVLKRITSNARLWQSERIPVLTPRATRTSP